MTITRDTPIVSDTAPIQLYTLLDCTTYGQLTDYLNKRGIDWEWAERSDMGNTIKLKYKGNVLIHDFEITKG
jgi:hypothetical protein